MDYISTVDENLTEGLELQYHSCYYCGGYYGPSFGEPTCATCHAFIHNEDFRNLQFPDHEAPNRYETEMEEKDDGDSGNDEPSEEAGAVGRSNSDLERRRRAPIPEVPSPDEEMEPDAGAQRDADVEEEEELLGMDVGAEQNPEDMERREPIRPPTPEPDPLSNRLALLTTPRPAYECGQLTPELEQRIPPEIWAAIFKKLDDVSMVMASKVNKKWKGIVADLFPTERWEEFAKERWPLFNPVYPVQDWFSLYSDLIDSVPCKYCFMCLGPNSRSNGLDMDQIIPVRSLRTVRLQKEIKWLRIDHPDGIEAVPLDKLNYNWLARIHGPPQSVYQGGVFYLNLKVPADYPIKPPVVRFLTKLFHPNVSRHGDIGIDCIQHNWTLALTISQILLSVQSLLTDPYVETSMEPAIAQLYMTDRKAFEKIAKVWTWKYAMHDLLCH